MSNSFDNSAKHFQLWNISANILYKKHLFAVICLICLGMTMRTSKLILFFRWYWPCLSKTKFELFTYLRRGNVFRSFSVKRKLGKKMKFVIFAIFIVGCSGNLQNFFSKVVNFILNFISRCFYRCPASWRHFFNPTKFSRWNVYTLEMWRQSSQPSIIWPTQCSILSTFFYQHAN